MRLLSRYLAVLQVPGSAAFCAAGAVARLPMGMIGLALVLMITGLGGSYTLAGAVAGTAVLSSAAVSPLLGRLADRRGQARVLGPQLVVYAAAVAGLVALALTRAPGWSLVLTAVGVGLGTPLMGAFTRARWNAVLTGSDRLGAALALESLIDEAVFVIGPFLAGVLSAAVAPAAGVVACLALVVLGSVWFLRQPATEPPVHELADTALPRGAMRHRGLMVLVLVFLSIGALFGLIEVGVVAVTRDDRQAGAAGAILGLWAAGSLVSGLIYGVMTFRSGAGRHLMVGAAGMAAGAVLVAVAGSSPLTLTIALVIAGTANAPTLIAGNTLVPSLVTADVLTAAYAWVGISIPAGIALGAPLGGVLVDQLGPRAPLWASIGAATTAAIIAAIGRRALEPGAAEWSRTGPQL